MAKSNRTLAFLGFGKKPKAKAGEEGETEEEREAREQAEREASTQAKSADDDDDEDADEDDEDEDKVEAADDKKAVRKRNGLRAAGHRRGVSAERARLATIMNGVTPAQAEMALHLALNTDLPADQARAAVDKSPQATGGSSFTRAMEQHRPPVGAGGGGGPPAKTSLADRMRTALKLPA